MSKKWRRGPWLASFVAIVSSVAALPAYTEENIIDTVLMPQ